MIKIDWKQYIREHIWFGWWKRIARHGEKTASGGQYYKYKWGRMKPCPAAWHGCRKLTSTEISMYLPNDYYD